MARDEALVRLAAAARELADSVVLTAVDGRELEQAANQLEAINARLRSHLGNNPPRPDLGPDGRMRALGNPVIGEANPVAPPLTVATAPDGTARAGFELGDVYEGPPGLVHGGICALILDHLLGSAGGAGGNPGMTANLSLRFRRPTPLHAPLTARAWTEGVEGRQTRLAGEITRSDGRATVEASGLFIMPAWAVEMAE